MKMTTSDMELAAKYLRTNDVGDAAGAACVRIATALEARASAHRQKIIKAAMTEPPNRGVVDRMANGDKGWDTTRYRK